MSKLSGLFDRFVNLDQINPELVLRWLPFRVKPLDIENLIANRLLYPQAIPVTIQEMEIDLAILREAIRLNPHLVYNHNLKRLTISEDYVVRFTPLNALITAIIDGLDISGVSEIQIRQPDASVLSGSVIVPIDFPHEAKVSVEINGETKEYDLGTIPTIESKVRQNNIKVGKHTYNATSGSLGILLDLRRSKNHD